MCRQGAGPEMGYVGCKRAGSKAVEKGGHVGLMCLVWVQLGIGVDGERYKLFCMIGGERKLAPPSLLIHNIVFFRG